MFNFLLKDIQNIPNYPNKFKLLAHMKNDLGGNSRIKYQLQSRVLKFHPLMPLPRRYDLVDLN